MAKKRSGCLTVLFVFIGVIVVAVLAVYFLLPGLSRPRNLGVKTSNEAYESAVQKLKLIKDDSPTEGTAEDYKYSYGSPQAVDVTFSSEEITSFINTNRPPYYALKNVQVRINPDNTVETSATVDTSYVFNYILDGKYSRDDAKRSLPMLGIIPGKVNVYTKFGGRISDNKVDSVSIYSSSVMGIPIPQSLVNSNDAQRFIRYSVDNYINKEAVKQNSKYELIEVRDEKVVFKGQIPSSISRIPVR